MSDDLQATIERIRKMLALAECNGATEHEAATAARMAQRTMEKYNLTHADLIRAEIESGREIDAEHFFCRLAGGGIARKVPKWVQWMACAIAELNDCVVRVAVGKNQEALRIYGFNGDRQCAAQTLVTVYALAHRAAENCRGRVAVNDFMKGYALGVCRRVYEALEYRKRAMSSAAASGTSLVIAKREALTRQLGETASKTLSPKISVRDEATFLQGFSLGRKANVTTKGLEEC